MSNLDLYEYAEEHGITVEWMDLQKNKSLSAQIGDRDYIGMDIDIVDGSADERSRLAHEIGHCVTGAYYDKSASRAFRARQEYRADKWAVMYCVPKNKLSGLIKRGYNRYEIAEQFGVTEQMIQKAIYYYKAS